jgi:hypothetical protein
MRAWGIMMMCTYPRSMWSSGSDILLANYQVSSFRRFHAVSKVIRLDLYGLDQLSLCRLLMQESSNLYNGPKARAQAAGIQKMWHRNSRRPNVNGLVGEAHKGSLAIPGHTLMKTRRAGSTWHGMERILVS